MEILIIIVLVIGGWLFYKQVDKLNKDVVWLKKEIQEIQTKVREIDGTMKKLSQKEIKTVSEQSQDELEPINSPMSDE